MLRVIMKALPDTTVIQFTSHAQDIILFDEVIYFDKNRIVESGAPRELMLNPNSRLTQKIK